MIQDETTATTVQAAVAPSVWRLFFDLEKNPLTLNGSRGGHHRKNQWVKAIRNRTAAAAGDAGIPHMPRCQAQLRWYVRTKRTRDVDNLAPLEKAMFDGLVSAGVVDDDKPALMLKHRPLIIPVDPMSHQHAWMELWVGAWSGDPNTPALALGALITGPAWWQERFIAEAIARETHVTIPIKTQGES